MDRYSNVHTRMWYAKDFKALDDEDKLLFIYLITSPHSNSAGYYRLPLGYAAHDLGKSSERVSKGFRSLSESGFIAYDEDSEVVLVRNYLRYNPIQNINQAKGTARVASAVPDSPLLGRFLTCVEEHAPQHMGYFEELYEKAEAISESDCSETVPKGLGKGSERASNTSTSTSTSTNTNTCASTEVDSLECNNSQVEDVEAEEVTVQPDESTKKPRKPFKSKLQESLFDCFWSEYPKKRSKGQAEKTWAKIKPSEQLLAQMLDALERAKTSHDWTKEGGKFIPYPSTWLNAKGWEDEYTATEVNNYAKHQRNTSGPSAFANREPQSNRFAGLVRDGGTGRIAGQADSPNAG